MVLVKIVGGLGNQMFQYAVARHVAIKNNTQVKFKDFTQKEGIKRNFHLNFFKTKGSKISDIELNTLRLGNYVMNKFPNALTRRLGYSAYAEKTDNGAPFDQIVLKLRAPNIYLEGFWQSFKYFDEIAGTIKDDFTVSTQPNDYSATMLGKIVSSNAVALHVRRGDYVSDKNTNAYHGVCSIEYYQECIKYIKEHVEDPHFFLFSDEPDWALENIKTGCPTEVSYNPAELDYEDMRLMYSCKHFIIANSSLSWWGAWLSRSENKIVLAPKNWYQSTERDTSDLIPPSWIRI
jgi:hypothetical protein